MRILNIAKIALRLIASVALGGPTFGATLLNVSYDVTREFYKDYNALFADHFKATTKEVVTISQSHGGSSSKIRDVINGLPADVVTMNQALDIDALAKANLIPANWATRLPNDSAPSTSTILFVVRKGNPKGIKDWADLVKSGVSVVIPNPKTSGNGRYSYMAAWGYALRRPGGSETEARDFVKRLFANVPVLNTGGREATTTFARHANGDVLLTFENEVASMLREYSEEGLEAVVPTTSILAENPVVWVDKVVAKNGTEKLARAYLEYLYSPEAQELAAKHYFRPRDPTVLARYADRFKPIQFFTVNELFGSWTNAQKTHFADGALFDQIYEKK